MWQVTLNFFIIYIYIYNIVSTLVVSFSHEYLPGLECTATKINSTKDIQETVINCKGEWQVSLKDYI